MTVRYLRPQERITMKSIVPKQRSLTVSILSLSLLTVMAGAAVATLISGLLANISWRLSFLVYLMGLISIVLCLAFMPNDRIGARAVYRRISAAGLCRRRW